MEVASIAAVMHHFVTEILLGYPLHVALTVTVPVQITQDTAVQVV